jgi:hypothetical protein
MHAGKGSSDRGLASAGLRLGADPGGCSRGDGAGWAAAAATPRGGQRRRQRVVVVVAAAARGGGGRRRRVVVVGGGGAWRRLVPREP